MELIIDLDSLLYKAGFSVETKVRHIIQDGTEIANFKYIKDVNAFLKEQGLKKEYVEIQEEHIVDTEDSAIKLLDILLSDIKNEFSNYNATMYLGGTNNFRFDIKADYKANRANMPRPVHLDALTQYAISKGAIVPDGYEADDAVCMHAWDCILSNKDYVIAGIDKDLKQIPGRHFDYTNNTILDIDTYEADFNFYTQLLTGDTSDNITGIRGIGPKKAAAILSPCDSEVEMYSACDGVWSSTEDMLISAQLLYLLRHENDRYKPPLA